MKVRFLALVLAGGLFGVCNNARCVDEPVGVRLTGHVSFNSETWPFEIVMEGYDRYYCIEWYSQPKALGMAVAKSAVRPSPGVALAIDDLYGSRDRAYVARRLWQGNKFRGVAPDQLREMLEYGHDTEEFMAPVSLDHFPVPLVIKWTANDSMPENTSTYTIEKVEFIYQRNPQFWADARKKYFYFQDHMPPPQFSWHEPLSPAQIIASNALLEAKQNPDAAVSDLRAALAQFPLHHNLGCWNQSVLLGALWQIRGMAEKDELVAWFYKTAAHEPNPRKSRNGDLDHGPLCLLRAIEAAARPDTAALVTAIIADPRFDETDYPTIKQITDTSYEGYPVPKQFSLEDRTMNSLPKLAEQLLPLWRNSLRRHYGLPEEKLPPQLLAGDSN